MRLTVLDLLCCACTASARIKLTAGNDFFYVKSLRADWSLYPTQRIPPDIARLCNLTHLDLSGNKLRSLPAELGDMTHLRELLLNNNVLRCACVCVCVCVCVTHALTQIHVCVHRCACV